MNFEDIEDMTDEELATALKNLGVKVGPITATTRHVYERKLAHIHQDDIPAATTQHVYERKLAHIHQDDIPADQFGDFFNSSIMSSENIKEMTNEELAAALKNAGVTVGPITGTTRLVYERKLARVQQVEVPAAEEDEEMEEDQDEDEPEPEPEYEEKPSERLTSVHQRFTSPLTSKISGGNNPPTYIGTPGSSQLNTSLTRKPLSSMREEVKFTSLRNSQAGSSASAASTPKKKGMSIIVKLLILIVFGLIVWLIYINFESPAAKPLLTSNH